MSVLGPIPRARAYEYCHRRGHGWAPWDDAGALTPQRLTPAAEERAAMAGAVGNRSAEAADKALPKRSGPRASAATTERATGAAGGRRGAPRHRGQTFGPQAAWDWHPDAHGRTGAAVGIDATGVPHQAPGGGAAAGGRPSGAAVSNAVPDVPRGNPHRPAPRVGGHAPGEDGPDARWHLRALVKSERGQWGALWGRQTTAPKAN